MYPPLVLLIVVGGLSGHYAVWHFQVMFALDEELAAARARGEPVWFSDLAPEPLAEGQNAAALFLQAVAIKPVEPLEFHEALRSLQNAELNGGQRAMRPSNEPILKATLEANAESLELMRCALL